MVRFSKFTPKQEVYRKFEELVWRETLFYSYYQNKKGVTIAIIYSPI